MEFIKTISFSCVAQLVMIAGLGSVSFANQGVDRDVTSRASVQQEVRAIPVKVEGPMSCGPSRTIAENVDQSIQDPAAACELTVHDTNTNRDYHIEGSSRVKDDAMTLFRAGKRSVMIEGRTPDSQTLIAYRIDSVSTPR